MRPQVFGREAVLEAALEIVRERGHDALSARTVAERAGCSIQPIYSLFGGMGGLMEAAYAHAREWAAKFADGRTAGAAGPFAASGWAHLLLAREEPRVFEFLYLSPYMKVDGLHALYDAVADPAALESIVRRTGLSEGAARELYLNMIVYVHGLACLLVAGAGIGDGKLEERVMGACETFLDKAREER